MLGLCADDPGKAVEPVNREFLRRVRAVCVHAERQKAEERGGETKGKGFHHRSGYQARNSGATAGIVLRESGGMLIRVAVRLCNVAREADAN
jgi:hypothetical protein